MELLKKYEGIEMYDTEDETEDIIEAFKDLKKGKTHSAREILKSTRLEWAALFQWFRNDAIGEE